MRVIPWLRSLVRAEVPLHALDPFRNAGIDAYELVDELPRGPAKLAAWSAYALQTYGDKLMAASEPAGSVQVETAELARASYHLAGACLQRARRLAADPPQSTQLDLPDRLPHWHTPLRSQEQLIGMRETLEALRVHIAFDVESFAGDGTASISTLRQGLAAVDAKLETVDRLWIARPPAEIRGGIGDALTTGLDRAYALGQLAANPDP